METGFSIHRLFHFASDVWLFDYLSEVFQHEFHLVSVSDPVEFSSTLSGSGDTAVVISHNPPSFDGIAVLEELHHRHPFLPLFLYCAEELSEVIRRAFISGASDVFTRNFLLQNQPEIVKAAFYEGIHKNFRLEACRKEQTLLNDIFEHNPYAAAIYNREGRLIRGNQAYYELFKIPLPPEMDIFHIPAFEKDPEYARLIQDFKLGEQIRTSPIWVNTRDLDPEYPDNPINIAGLGFCIRNRNDEITNYVVITPDMTEQIKAEEALKKALVELKEARDFLELRVKERTDELAHINKHLKHEAGVRKKLAAELKKKNNELEDFASRVSHDLKNNLLAIRRLIECSLHDPDSQEACLQSAVSSVEDMSTYIESLLNLARAGRTLHRMEEVHLTPIIREIFHLLKPAGINAELRIKSELPVITCDSMSIETMLENLVSNSFTYRDQEKPSVLIEVSPGIDGNILILSYKDNGMGIDAEHIGRVFDAGFTTQRKIHNGFGMAISRKIIEAHGGTISVQSEGKGKGVEFFIALPVYGTACGKNQKK